LKIKKIGSESKGGEIAVFKRQRAVKEFFPEQIIKVNFLIRRSRKGRAYALKTKRCKVNFAPFW